MTSTPGAANGGKILVDALVTHGVDRAFCVPGESYLAVLDALYDVREKIELIVCRQEGGAAFMAEAYGKLTGKPGICFVTRGPGATNAAIGVHTAQQDSTPLILFIGQVGSDVVEREAFQEMDYRRMYRADGEMGRADRPRRPHSGNGEPRFPSRGIRTPGAGGARAARRHAHGRSDCTHDRDALSPHRRQSRLAGHGADAPPDDGRREAVAGARWRRLDGGGVQEHPALRRTQCAAGGVLVPPAGPVRQHATTSMRATSASASRRRCSNA